MYTIEQHKRKEIMKLDSISESAKFDLPIEPNKMMLDLKESESGSAKKVLVVEVDAIHEGLTANYNYYTQYGLKEGLKTWTHPYKKPVLTHHNQYSGEAIGRIAEARELTSSESKSGRNGLRFVLEISDPDAIEKVLDGRYQTVSIGSQTNKATCNICQTDRTKEWCEHWKGESYDGVECHFILGTIHGKEVSFVNTPADEDAGSVSYSFKESATTGSVLLTGESEIYDIKNDWVNLYESYSEQAKQKHKELFNERFKIGDDKENAEMKELAEFLEGKVGSSEKDKVKSYIESLESKANESEKLLAVASTKTISLESQIAQAQTEKEDLVKENDNLKQQMHLSLAEKVVDMKILLRKPDAIAESKEEHLKKYTEKSKDVLESLHEELSKEVSTMNEHVEPGSVKNPAKSSNGEKEEHSSINESIELLGRAWANK